MAFNKDSQKIINESKNQAELTAVLKNIQQWLDTAAIVPTDLQWTILINHVNEMIKRAQENEKVPTVDPEVFAEVSAEALDISKQVVEHIGNLPEDEKYLLSIHFETAKQNN